MRAAESAARDCQINHEAHVDALQERVDDLRLAAIRLRDAELEVKAAQAGYRDALQAFNRHVAPVPE